MKISKKLREQAAQLCSALCFASGQGDDVFWMCDVINSVCADVGASNLAVDARANVRRVPRNGTSEDYAMAWAEAECLLRTGWEPS